MSALTSSHDAIHNKEGGQYLTFMMNDEEYGTDILRVMEIRGWESPTPLPYAPSYIRGVINLRGTIVPIIDLRERFKIEPKEYDPTTVVIVLQTKMHDGRERVMGIVVDAVSEVYNIETEMLKDAPDVGHTEGKDCITGIATIDASKMLILLDVDQLFSPDEQEALLDTIKKAE